MIEQPNNPNNFNDPNNPNNPNNSNFQNIIQNVENQQANDPELYPTMKKVIEESEKKYSDQRKEETEKMGESESLIKSGSMKKKIRF